MANRKAQLIALTFLAIFLITFVVPPIHEEIVTDSQTRESKLRQGVNDLDYHETHFDALADPTYNYGTSTTGSYLKTFLADDDYHISTSSSTTTPASFRDLAIGEPTITYGTKSGTYDYTFTQNSIYQSVASESYYGGSASADKLATGAPTYTYGSSTSGTYQDTWSSNDVWHQSTTSSYSNSEYDYPYANPQITYGSIGSGSYTDVDDDNGVYQRVDTASYTSPSIDTGYHWCETYEVWGSDTITWNNPDRGTTEDGWCAWTSSGTGYTKYFNDGSFTFGLPSDATVVGIQIGIKRQKASGTSVTDNTIQLGLGGIGMFGNNKATGAAWSTSLAYVYFGGSSDTWGYSWSVTAMNAVGYGSIGANVRAYCKAASAYIDVIKMECWYTDIYYRFDYYYIMKFTTNTRSEVTYLEWQINGYASYINVHVWIWNGASWVDTGQDMPVSENTISAGVTPSTYMTADGYMYIRFTNTQTSLSAVYNYVDYIRWYVNYNLYRSDFYYSMQFTEVPKAYVTQIDYYFEGKTSGDTVQIWIYQFATSTWINTGKTWTTSESTQSATNIGSDYMHSDGTMRVRFYISGLQHSRVTYADYLRWHVSYTPISYRVDYCYTMQFTNDTRATVTDLDWGSYGYSTVASKIYLYNWTASAWYDTGQTVPVSNSLKEGTGISITSFMHSNGSMKIRYAKDLQESTFTNYVDWVYFYVTWGAPSYSLDLYYQFDFTNASKDYVTAVDWGAEGKTSNPTMNIYIYNYVGSTWTDTGADWTTSETTQGGEGDRTLHVASNCSMAMRFAYSEYASSFTASIDHIWFNVTWVCPVSDPTLEEPTDGETVYTLNPTLEWNGVEVISGNLYTYRVALDDDSDFSSPTINLTTSNTWYNVITSLPVDTFYWKVRAIDYLGNAGAWSGTYNFTTTSSLPTVVATVGTYAEPTYTYGSTSSGLYTETHTSNNSYQVATSVIYYNGSQQGYADSAVSDDSVGTEPWGNPSYSLVIDGDFAYAGYVVFSEDSEYLKVTDFDFDLSGVTVDGIIVTIDEKKGYGSSAVTDIVVKLLKGGSIVGDNKANGAWTVDWVYDEHGNNKDKWGTTWSIAEIEASDFGVVLQVNIGSLNQAQVDCIYITVYSSTVKYRADLNYSFQFIASDIASIQSMTWLTEGKTSSGSFEIYRYNYLTSTWDASGYTISTTEITQTETVDQSKYMDGGGYMKLRFYEYDETSTFTISTDFIKWNVIFSLATNDTTGPTAPEPFYPSHAQNIGFNSPIFCWNETTDISGIDYYTVVSSPYSDFSSIDFNETTDKTWYQASTMSCSQHYWKVRATDESGNVGSYSSAIMFYTSSDPEVYISYYDLDGWGVDFSSVKTYINGSRITNPYVSYPAMNTYINLTVTDYFGNELFQEWFNITSTPYYIDEQIQLCEVTLKAYGLTMCNITSSGMVKSVPFDTSVKVKLMPATYTFNGTAWDGAISFDISREITYTVNRLIELCKEPLVIHDVTFSTSEDYYAFSASASKTTIWMKVYDNDTLVYPKTYTRSILTEKSTVFGWHNLTLNIGDDDGYSYNYTFSYSVIEQRVTIELYSSVDGFGLDFSLVQVWINGTEVFTNEVWVEGATIHIEIKDFFGQELYDVNATYASVIRIGLGFYEVILSNNGYNGICVNMTLSGYSYVRSVWIPADSSVTVRICNGTYNAIAYGERESGTMYQFNERTITVAGSGTQHKFLDQTHPSPSYNSGWAVVMVTALPTIVAGLSIWSLINGVYQSYRTTQIQKKQDETNALLKGEEEDKGKSSSETDEKREVERGRRNDNSYS